MGSFHTSCNVQNLMHRDRKAAVPGILVDTGSAHTWIPSSILDEIGIIPEQKRLSMIMANGFRAPSVSRSSMWTKSGQRMKWFSPTKATFRYWAPGRWRG